jgi:hypothetical protein
MEVVRVALNDFHGLEVLQLRLAADFIFTGVSVVRQMAYVCDVAHVSNLVTNEGQVAVDRVEGQKGPHVAQMHIGVNRRATYIHPHSSGHEGLKPLLHASEAVVYAEGLHGG